MLNSLLHLEKTHTGTNLNGSFATVLINHLKENNMQIINIVNVGRFDAELTINYKGKQTKLNFAHKSANEFVNIIKKRIK